MAWTAGAILTAAQLNTYLPQTVTTWPSPFNAGITIGNGVTIASYAQYGGNLVIASLHFTVGSTTTMGAVAIDLPVASASGDLIGCSGFCDDAGVKYPIFVNGSTTVQNIRVMNTAGTYGVQAALSATVPMTWATGDILAVDLFYFS